MSDNRKWARHSKRTALLEIDGKMVSLAERNKMIWMARREDRPRPEYWEIGKQFGLHEATVKDIIHDHDKTFCEKIGVEWPGRPIGPTPRWIEDMVQGYYTAAHEDFGLLCLWKD